MQFTLSCIRRLSLSLAFVCVAPIAHAAPDDSGTARVEQFLQGLQSFEASFNQRLTDKSGRILDESSGRLAIQRPNRFRWDYQAPAEQVIVADGKRIWLYDPELEQVTVRRLDDSLSATPAMLLSGEGKLQDNFKVTRVKRERNVDWVTLEPVRADTDFKSVTLGFVGSELRHMQLADKLNQTTSLEFADMHSNIALDPQRFTFTPPPGTDVIGGDATQEAAR
ncbi:MAG: outer membrane lipoprotein chaperone LolA [Steroidobacteraceae bacterium]